MLSKERLGKFTASRITELLAGGEGKTRFKYILEKAEEIVKGHEKDAFRTKDTEHGEFNEYEGIQAFEHVTGFNVTYLDQKYFPINENCGTTPDLGVYDFGGTLLASGDMKCPTTTFFQQKLMILQDAKKEYQNCSRAHYFQVQMQMLSMNVDRGYLIRYLTSMNVDQDGNKHEYNLPLESRLFYKEVKKDEQAQEIILRAVEKAAKERDELVEQLIKPFVYEPID